MKRISLSVIVPVYNEEKTVATLLKKLVGQRFVKEVIVIDDGSQDKSVKKVVSIRNKKIKLFKKKNGGKGSAVRMGLQKVSGEYTIIQDADLEYDPEDISDMLDPIRKGKAEIVYGSRFLGPHLNLLFWHRVGNDFLNLLTNILYNTTLSDMETCYKIIPTHVFKKLNISAKGFDLEPEITCKLLKKGYRIYEVPISYVGRDFSEGKKITWRDGIDALKVILGIRFLPDN